MRMSADVMWMQKACEPHRLNCMFSSVLRSDLGDSGQTPTERKHSGLSDLRPGSSPGGDLRQWGGPQRMEWNI